MSDIDEWNRHVDAKAPYPAILPLAERTVVRARVTVWDDGKGPTKDFPTPHAQPGDLGTVEHFAGVDDNWPTVRFWKTGTATCVTPAEVEAMHAQEPAGEHTCGADDKDPDETADAWKRAVDAVDTLAPPISKERILAFLEEHCDGYALDDDRDRKNCASKLAKWLRENDALRPLAQAMAPTFAHVAAWLLTDETGCDGLIEVGGESHDLDADELAELTGVSRDLFESHFREDKPT
jgi:hypothetical protein